jgi:CRISPR/Cas system-associated exonuclease Cas4 (RecB family)
MRADLRGWLQQAAASSDWSPAHAEFEFDLRLEPEGVCLRGAIDLVERHHGGALRVVDHKTGAMPKDPPQIVGKGEVLQPVLYAMAAEQALGEGVIGGRLAYATLRQNFRTVDIPLNDFARQRAGEVLRAIDGAIRGGFLPAAPRAEACRHCDYLPVCGPYEEERVGRKSQAELRSLKEVRRLP